MIAIVEGQLVTSKMRQPEAGQEFKPHQLLSTMQIDNGDADIVKVKDMDLARTHKAGANVRLKCAINHWSNSNMSGQSVTLLDVL